MIYREKIIEALYSTLKGASKASGGKELHSICPICGGSRSDRNRKTFYISTREDQPMQYICFRASCGAQGLVTPELLNSWGITDLELSVGLAKELNNFYKNRPMEHIVFKQSTFSLLNYTLSDNESSSKKLEYINTRLGINLTYEDILRNKIVLNILDVLKQNNISNLTRDPRTIKEFNKYYLGFISVNNGYINLKNLDIDKTYSKKRYENYNIFGDVDNSLKFYTIPTNIDLDNPNDIILNIAEGPFDILSIYYNLDSPKYNSIFCSVNGSGYLSVIKYFIFNLRLINLEVHIYRDNDMDDSTLYYISRELSKVLIPVYIHTNTYEGEKDFGVTKDKIKEIVWRIS